VSDYLVRVLTKDGTVRGLACITTELTAELCRRHATFPTASVALGRALTGGALFGALLKAGQRVAFKFEGNGPLQKILVEADATGAVRGCVGNPAVDLLTADGSLDVAGALGRAGFLSVTKDLGMKEPYRGTIMLHSSEIAEDLALYMTESEQIPSAVGLGVFVEPDGAVSVAGGFLVQAMPPGNSELVDTLMARIGVMPPITTLLKSGMTPEGLIDYLFEGVPYDIIEKRVVAFQCSCSRERTERALLSLGRDDLQRLIVEQEETDVVCEFCREHYHFSREELEGLVGDSTETQREDMQ
jgi:molecular chaperone Hsp33